MDVFIPYAIWDFVNRNGYLLIWEVNCQALYRQFQVANRLSPFSKQTTAFLFSILQTYLTELNSWELLMKGIVIALALVIRVEAETFSCLTQLYSWKNHKDFKVFHLRGNNHKISCSFCSLPTAAIGTEWVLKAATKELKIWQLYAISPKSATLGCSKRCGIYFPEIIVELLCISFTELKEELGFKD
jgi:hypothetical protein